MNELERDGKALGVMLASVFSFCRGFSLERVLTYLMAYDATGAELEALMQPGRPLGVNWRIPVIPEADQPLVQEVLQAYGLNYPPRAREWKALLWEGQRRHGMRHLLVALEEWYRRHPEELRQPIKEKWNSTAGWWNIPCGS